MGYDGNIPPGSLLYYASLCGFRDLAAHLVNEHPQHLNAQVGRNRSPLEAALRSIAQHCAANTSTLQSYYTSAVQTWILGATIIVLCCMLHRSMDLLISRSGYSSLVEMQTRARTTTRHHYIWQ